MSVRQIITHAISGRTLTEEISLTTTLEKDEAKHLESGVINLYPDLVFQEIDGFGGALTDSVGYLYSTMSPEDKKQFLESYFGESGLQYRFLRMHMDSCDFSLEEYQAVEDPLVDPELSTFSIERDRKYMLPMLKDIMEMSSSPISVLLSPWSPPRQWKMPPIKPKNDPGVYGGNSILEALMPPIDYEHPSRNNGGKLKPEHYGDWARYLAKYVLAYLEEGVPVTMMSLQNETIAATSWDSCVWTAEEQKCFLKDYLYPEFKKQGLTNKVGLYIWDHNKERVVEYARGIIDDETLGMLEGIAFHWYSGDHFEALELVKSLYPTMKLMSSECCSLRNPCNSEIAMDMAGNASSVAELEYDDAVAYAHDLIGDINHGMTRWMDWNLCVNKDGGPRHVMFGFGAPVCVNEDGTYRKLLTFDFIGHFAKYIQSGAHRIGLSRCYDRVEATAVKNPDGTIAMIVLNRGNRDECYAIRMEGKIIRFIAPAGTISTIVIE
ncbi:MAG: glycoside hydrolase [Lachnospiraceae bacterium]|nr:glycoside hydrolase [Lachnospiraceae bacterium]